MHVAINGSFKVDSKRIQQQIDEELQAKSAAISAMVKKQVRQLVDGMILDALHREVRDYVNGIAAYELTNNGLRARLEGLFREAAEKEVGRMASEVATRISRG